MAGAYSIVTYLEKSYGREINKSLNISSKSIKELKKWANKNDPDLRRKAFNKPEELLSREEKDRLNRAIKQLVDRVIAVESGHNPDDLLLITMDLLGFD